MKDEVFIMNAIVKISDFEEIGSVFTSMSLNTVEEKKIFHNATQNPDYKISDFINKTFFCKDIFMQKTLIHDNDGEEKEVIQTIFVTPEGEGILSNSIGVAKSVMSILNIFGLPSEWGFGGLELEVKEVNFKNGRYFKVLVK